MQRSAIKAHEFPHMTTANCNCECNCNNNNNNNAAFIYVKVNLQYLRKVRHTRSYANVCGVIELNER